MKSKRNNWINSHCHKMCPLLLDSMHKLNQPLNFLRWRWTKIPVIVQLEDSRKSKVKVQELAHMAGCEIDSEIPLINLFTTRANSKTLELLVRNPLVKNVWLDREARTSLNIASPTVQAPKLWKKKVNGKGITIAILDTGIYNHPDLKERIVGFKDFVNKRRAPYDDNGHGTHVAGNACSNGSRSDLKYRAPAFDAQLVGVKVLNKDGVGRISTIIKGIQWCIRNKERYEIRVINMSLGSEAIQSYKKDPLCQAAEKAWQNGIVVCAAAGNSGPKEKTIDSPGIDPIIITVGALDDRGTAKVKDDKIANFSSRGPTVDGLNKPDILAPGVNIVSLLSAQAQKYNQKEKIIDKVYISLSGTSMATGVCSGVVAQLLQNNRELTPDEVKKIITDTAYKVDHLDANLQGSGLIDSQKASVKAKKYK